MTVPRVRMFAGPNGSGKSTILGEFARRYGPAAVGAYVNADDIERALRSPAGLDLAPYGAESRGDEVEAFVRASEWLAAKGHAEEARAASVHAGRLRFPGAAVNSYLAAVVAEFLRQALVQAGTSFTFETVMSSPDKLDFLRHARDAGYKTYLYFVTTDDPEVNLSRVRDRVRQGGHDVDPGAVVARYRRSLALLPGAARIVHRAYLFDNTTEGNTALLLAEIRDGELEFCVDAVPAWFATAFPPDQPESERDASRG